MDLTAFASTYGTDEACRAHMESLRWPGGPVCPGCGSVNNAVPVSTKPGRWRCRACNRQFNVLLGTALEGTHLPLRVWYLAMYLMLSTAKPISAMSLHRQLGIQYRTCWHLLHRLRAMLASGEKLPLSGIIEADGTYVGGKPENLPKGAPRPGKRGRGTTKPMLFAAIERGGEARTVAVPSASVAAIAPAPWGWTRGAATLMTDELGAYRWPDAERQSGIGRKMEAYHRVNHSQREYARTTPGGLRAHVNTAEGFFSLFKRGIFGIATASLPRRHHQVSPKHLHRYVRRTSPFDAAGHEFRYNGRKHDATERIACCLIGRHGRLRLRELFA